MIHHGDIVNSLLKLEIDSRQPVLVHCSLTAIGTVEGGVESLLRGLQFCFDQLVMPAFTYQTMLVPKAGPENNGLEYGSGLEQNRQAEFFHPGLPVHASLGVVAEHFRQQASASRTLHPILSFAGVNAADFLHTQEIYDPLQPVGALAQAGGWVLLIGVDQRANTSIHYAERAAGRKQFIRWALTPRGVVECPRFPGCPDDFNSLGERVHALRRAVRLGRTTVQAYPLEGLVSSVVDWITEDRLALLCDSPTCMRCQAVRADLKGS